MSLALFFLSHHLGRQTFVPSLSAYLTYLPQEYLYCFISFLTLLSTSFLLRNSLCLLQFYFHFYLISFLFVSQQSAEACRQAWQAEGEWPDKRQIRDLGLNCVPRSGSRQRGLPGN